MPSFRAKDKLGALFNSSSNGSCFSCPIKPSRRLNKMSAPTQRHLHSNSALLRRKPKGQGADSWTMAVTQTELHLQRGRTQLWHSPQNYFFFFFHVIHSQVFEWTLFFLYFLLHLLVILCLSLSRLQIGEVVDVFEALASEKCLSKCPLETLCEFTPCTCPFQHQQEDNCNYVKWGLSPTSAK